MYSYSHESVGLQLNLYSLLSSPFHPRNYWQSLLVHAIDKCEVIETFSLVQVRERMASVLSPTATLFCSAGNAIPKLSVAKLSGIRFPNFGPFIVLEAASSLHYYHLGTVYFCQKNMPLVVCFASASARDDYGNFPDPSGDDDRDDGDSDDQGDYDSTFVSESSGDEIEIEIVKTGNNSRRIVSKVPVRASLQTVWNILTDYERLADFIPGLAVSQLLEKRDNFARLFQIGEQDLALGLKFKAKGTVDCFERDLQELPYGQKRDIDFKMVEGDFQLFEGKWSVEQEVKFGVGDQPSDSSAGQEFQTTLAYIVDVKPKMWLPVRLIEGRLCREIRKNLSCIRDEAEKAFQIANPLL